MAKVSQIFYQEINMNGSKNDVLFGFTQERFPGANHICLIYDDEKQVLQIYPFIAVKGQVVRNPYYIKPEEYFSEL
jgi:hypothetical protein